jgi:hypothetical protein
MSRTRTASFAIASAFFLVTACTAADSTATTTFQIATVTAGSDSINLARADGVLGGQTNRDGTACIWLINGRDKVALSWPHGYTARASPLTVYDNTGQPVAEVGEVVTLAGGLLGGDVRSIPGCPGFTKFWGVGEVVSAQ